MIALVIAGVGLIALFCVANYALARLDDALDAAFNGDRHE